jgi:hypothetical protein
VKQRVAILLIVFAAFFISACEMKDAYSGKIILSGEHVLKPGESLEGELLVTGGQVDLQPGSHLNGSLYVLGGDVKAAGEISGDVTILLGELSLTPEALVRGSLSIGGGLLQRAPDAQILGGTITSSAGQIPEPQRRSTRSLANRLVSIMIESPILAVLAYLAVHRFPRQITNIERAASEYTLLSGSLGLLTWFVGVSLLVLMAFTILLIPVTLIGIGVLLLATAYGAIPFALILGRWTVQRLKWKLTRAGRAAIGMVLLVCIFELGQLIPWVGSLAVLALMMVGFGAVLLTRFGLRRYTPPADIWESETESFA